MAVRLSGAQIAALRRAVKQQGTPERAQATIVAFLPGNPLSGRVRIGNVTVACRFSAENRAQLVPGDVIEVRESVGGVEPYEFASWLGAGPQSLQAIFPVDDSATNPPTGTTGSPLSGGDPAADAYGVDRRPTTGFDASDNAIPSGRDAPTPPPAPGTAGPVDERQITWNPTSGHNHDGVVSRAINQRFTTYEDVTSQVDGNRWQFDLSRDYIAGSLQIIKNGRVLRQGVEYTEHDDKRGFNLNIAAPKSSQGDTLVAFYQPKG